MNHVKDNITSHILNTSWDGGDPKPLELLPLVSLAAAVDGPPEILAVERLLESRSEAALVSLAEVRGFQDFESFATGILPKLVASKRLTDLASFEASWGWVASRGGFEGFRGLLTESSALIIGGMLERGDENEAPLLRDLTSIALKETVLKDFSLIMGAVSWVKALVGNDTFAKLVRKKSSGIVYRLISRFNGGGKWHNSPYPGDDVPNRAGSDIFSVHSFKVSSEAYPLEAITRAFQALKTEMREECLFDTFTSDRAITVGLRLLADLEGRRMTPNALAACMALYVICFLHRSENPIVFLYLVDGCMKACVHASSGTNVAELADRTLMHLFKFASATVSQPIRGEVFIRMLQALVRDVGHNHAGSRFDPTRVSAVARALLNALKGHGDYETLALLLISTGGSAFSSIGVEAPLNNSTRMSRGVMRRLVEFARDTGSPQLARIVAENVHRYPAGVGREFASTFQRYLVSNTGIRTGMVREAALCAAVAFGVPEKTHDGSNSSGGSVRDPYSALFDVLRVCVEDDNIGVRTEACRVARAILSTTIGQTEFAKCKDDIAAGLEVFAAPHASSEAPVKAKSSTLISFTFESGQLDYARWVRSVARQLLDSFQPDTLYCQLADLVQGSTLAAERLIKHILAIILTSNLNDTASVEASKKIKESLSQFLTAYRGESLPALRCVVDSLVHLRFLGQEGDRVLKQVAARNFPVICLACHRLGEHHAGILMFELARAENSAPLSELEVKTITQLVTELDEDHLEGVLSMTDLDEHVLYQHLKLEKRWTQSLLYSEANMAAQPLQRLFQSQRGPTVSGAPDQSREYFHAASQLGMFNTILSSVSGTHAGTLVPDADLQESVWRCGTWLYDVPPSTSPSTHTHLALTLRRLAYGSPEHCRSAVDSSWVNLSKSLAEDSSLNRVLVPRSLLLVEADEALQVVEHPSKVILEELIRRWNDRSEQYLQQHDFEAVEAVFAFRSHLLISFHTRFKGERTSESQEPRSSNVFLAEASKEHLSVLKSAAAVDSSGKAARLVTLTDIESAKVLWAQGSGALAVKLLALAQTRTSENEPLLRGKTAYLMAKWSHARRLEGTVGIFRLFSEAAKFLDKAAAETQGSAHGQTSLDNLADATEALENCWYAFARFADESYEALMADETHQALSELVRARNAELQELARSGSSDTRGLRRLQVQLNLDQNELSSHKHRAKELLKKKDVAVYRLCAHWLANSEDSVVNAILAKHAPRISSHIFVGLVYQLSARMTSDRSAFQTVLQDLILRMAAEHPFHCLYQIVALKNGAATTNTSPPAPSHVASASANAASAAILQRLVAGSAGAHVARHAVAINDLCGAYLEFAMLDVSGQSIGGRKRPAAGGTVRLDRKLRLYGLRDVSVPITTAALPVCPSKDYSHAETIGAFAKEFRLVGGVNVPKLVKGGADDLRQDAVLAKVFEAVNVVLAKDPRSRKRGLRVRTYRVVPLGQRAGVIEWVLDTIPVGEFLAEAHPRLHPGEPSLSDIRRKMMREHEREGSDTSTKLAVYQEIERQVVPVFRHFFLERFSDPRRWFECRLSYTRSVAANSIVGWVVGLGDRHVQNVLIDVRTGEVIQIDLGIAFDQGRLLSVPELVPFRLTREVVDGMGAAGLEGPFRRCCEETLRALRGPAGRTRVETILDVFRHDPLYQWTPGGSRRTDPAAATAATGGGLAQNRHAERALLGVRRRLAGDAPAASAQQQQGADGVERKVAELARAAADPANLCRMFPGW
ncbi:hypothetical protein HK405_008571 [Cladochytrium tenue]|nr:hypothetical protein HK405_008571 [Cladochytrium tenue]